MVAQVLEFYGLEKQNKWAQLGYESLFFVGFTILAWAVSYLHKLVWFPSFLTVFLGRRLFWFSLTILKGCVMQALAFVSHQKR